MLVSGLDQRACDFDARMAGLNRLLRVRQIATNESIQVRGFRWVDCHLGKTSFLHVFLLFS